MRKPTYVISAKVSIRTGRKTYEYVILNEEIFPEYVNVVKRCLPSKLVLK